MEQVLDRPTFKQFIKKMLLNYSSWIVKEGLSGVDEAVSKIADDIPGEVPRAIVKVISKIIHVAAKAGKPFGEVLSKISRTVQNRGSVESGRDYYTHDVSGNKIKVTAATKSSKNKKNNVSPQILPEDNIIKEKEGEGNMAKNKKTASSNGGGGARSRRGKENSLNPIEEGQAKIWGRNGSGYKTRRDFFGTGENDLGWYDNYPILSRGMIGANFGVRKGIPYNIRVNAPLNSFVVPSVMSLRIALTTGKSNGDPWQTSMDKLYAALRSANTGAVQYLKRNLDRYVLNLRFILAAIRYYRRAYGILNYYSLLDKSVPYALFKAMGLDYDSFANNAANLRNKLNYLCARLHTMMPMKNDLLERTCWMFDNIFVDSNDAKAQYYLFSLDNACQYIYDIASDNDVMLQSTNLLTNFANTNSSTGIDYNTAMTNLDAIVARATGSNEFSVIAADILKCFGTSQLGYFTAIEENYKVTPIYSEEVLTQIQNSRAYLGSPSATNTQDSRLIIKLDSRGEHLISEAYFVNANNPIDYANVDYAEYTFINMYKDDISNLDLLSATRLAWVIKQDSTYSYRYNITTFGTELIRGYYLVGDKHNNDTGSYAYDLFGHELSSFMTFSSTTDGGVQPLHLISLLSSFDWAPMIRFSMTSYYNASGTLSSSSASGYPIWDFNNYAMVQPSELNTYNNIAIMSLNYWPSLVKNTNLLTVK